MDTEQPCQGSQDTMRAAATAAGSDVHQILEQTRLRCQILEVDKEVEALRAKKYRKILGNLAGEDGTAQPQVAGAHHMPMRRTLMDVPRPTSSMTEGQIGSTTARIPPVHSPVAGSSCLANGRAVASHGAASQRMLQARSNSDEDIIVLDEEPHTGSSTSTSVLQPGTKRRNLSSHENPVQYISTRSRPSFDIPPESSGISTPDQSSADIPVVDKIRICKLAGLTRLKLTRAEAIRVEETPGIEWSTFNKIFGGNRRSEWPRCSRFPGYSNFLCADFIAQPYMPHTAGKPGLLFSLPTVTETPETEKYAIHVLSNRHEDGALYYQGKYTRVPVPGIHFQWSNLTYNFRNRWLKRICYSQSPTACNLRARIWLRNRCGHEPTAKEVQANLESFDNQVSYKEAGAAFQSGKEKLVLEGLCCTEYDSHLATIIQRRAPDI